MSHTLWLYLFDTISNILNAFFSYSNDFDIFRNIHNDIDVEISDRFSTVSPLLYFMFRTWLCRYFGSFPLFF